MCLNALLSVLILVTFDRIVRASFLSFGRALIITLRWGRSRPRVVQLTPRLRASFLSRLLLTTLRKPLAFGAGARLLMKIHRSWWTSTRWSRAILNPAWARLVNISTEVSPRLPSITLLSLTLLTVGIFIWYTASVYFLVPFNTWVFTILVVGGVGYTLASGFVYFTTRTSFGRQTDIGQRFWKRSFSVFWLLEGGLFATVVYLFLAAPNEIPYTYDTPLVFKTHFFLLDEFILRALVFNGLLFALHLLLLGNYQSRSLYLTFLHILVSVLFILLLYLELGVFYGYVNTLGSARWVFSTESYETGLELELSRSRVVHAFILFSSVVKFWHFAVIGIVWFFYLSRHFESLETRESLLTSTFQSFVILYGLNFLVLAPYLKYAGRRYLSNPYYWFFETPNYESLTTVLNLLRSFYAVG